MQEVREEGLGNIPSVSLEDLLEARAHFGHKKSKWNPKMAKYIFKEKNGYHIIDIRKTIPLMGKAYKFSYEHSSKGERFLFVCTKKNLKDIILSHAQKTNSFYVVERWTGGLLTNFETTKQRLKYMKELEMIFEEYSRGEGIYVKKEIIEFQKEYNKLNKKFGGVKNMENLPDVLIVVDPVKEQLAVNEARILKIPIIAICDTNADPDLIDYPIPANDDAIKSVSLIISYISDAIIKGKESLKWQI